MHTPEHSTDVEHDGASIDLSTRKSTDQDVDRREESTEASSALGTVGGYGVQRRAPRSAPETESAVVSGNRWMRLLADSVREMEESAAAMTAAGVSLKMRRNDAEFTPRAAGFKSFGQFLRAASKAGVVAIELPADTGSVDILVHSGSDASVETDHSLQPKQSAVWVRPELWKAFLDWSPDRTDVFDRTTRQVLPEPTGVSGADEVPIPLLSREMQIGWMQQLAADFVDPGLSQLLQHDLSGSDPVRAFMHTSRSNPRVSRAWSKALRGHLLEAIECWAAENLIPMEDILAAPESRARSLGVPRESSERIAGPGSLRREGVQLGGTQRLRQQLLTALARMPLSELMRIPIPVEYLLL